MKNVIPIALAAALLLSGCGGDDDEGGSEQPPQAQQQQPAQGTSVCLESWNAANPDQRIKASLTHRGDEPKDIYLGTYAGEPFTATGDYFDASGSTASEDISVARGDCVAVDRTSNEEETNWVMVAPKANGGGKAWYFVDETGDSPLAKSPQPLDDEQTVRIMGIGEDAKLLP